MQKTFLYGWLGALFIAAIGHPVGVIGSRLAVNYLNANPLVYSCFMMLFAGLGLLLFAGRGPIVLSTLRSGQTWVYGFLQVLTYILTAFLVMYVSVTEASVLLRVSTAVIFLLSFVILGQKITRYDFLGILIILFGIAYLFVSSNYTNDTEGVVLFILILCSVTQGLQKIIAETHKANTKDLKPKERIRLTGAIMSVTGLGMMFIFLFISIFKSSYNISILESFPNVAQYFNFKAIVLAGFMGVFILAIAKYCEFYSSKIISAKYLMAVVSIQPFFALFYENILDYYGILPIKDFSIEEMTSIAIVVAGSIFLAFAGLLKKDKVTDSIYNDEIVTNDTYLTTIKNMVALSYNFTNGNTEKASKLLKIDEAFFNEILETEKIEDLKIYKSEVKIIRDNFYNQIATVDPLTGLVNRLQFATDISKIIKQKVNFTLFYIDLNDFKILNDKHTHKVGDEALIATALRLKDFTDNAIASRLGGDEFVLIIKDLKQEETTVIEKLKQLLNKDIYSAELQQNINISASIGAAKLDSDKDSLDSLLKKADKNMYKDKRAKR